MDADGFDLSRAKFSTDDSLLNTDLTQDNASQTLGDGVVVSYDANQNGGYIVQTEGGETLPRHIVTVADPMGARPAMVWLCYELPDGNTQCIRVKAGAIHTHEAY